MTDIFLSILGISVSVSLIILILLLLSPFLNKRYAAKWKYWIWIFLALRLLVPFSGANEQLLTGLFLHTETQTISESGENHTDTPDDTTIPTRQIIIEMPTQMTIPLTVRSESSQPGITPLDIMIIVWMTGCVILISLHLISYLHYKRQVMIKGTLIEDVSVLKQVFKLKQELHIRHAIRTIEYEQTESPMIIGFFRPVLVLPKEQYNSQELFFILKHELVHLKRGDVYFKLLFVTANAVHWFNPLIWIMLKEAVIDMELSCDEKVTQGTSYAVKKAYTETLLSLLHRQCARQTVLSTQFYGGTKIMKKRFKNILIKGGKKNGICILLCVVIITISSGAMVGCSITQDTRENEDITENDTADMPAPPQQEVTPIEEMPANHVPADNNLSGDTAILIFSKEGEQEQKLAKLAIGDGYSLYLPENEWQASGPDSWTSTVNEQVRLEITHYMDESVDSVEQELEADDYVTVNYHKQKQEGDMIHHVELKASENDVWGIFYSYPVDAEEGWGRELPVIADTFALTIDTE